MTKTVNLRRYFSSFKYILIELICLFFCVMLIVNFDMCKKSIIHSLTLCSQTLIPSLFPFMFLSSFITQSGILESNSSVLNKISHNIIGMPYCAAVVFLLSIIGGFPVGAKMTKGLFERGAITQNQGNRLMLFCVNPSPAFAVNAVGVSLFGSKQIGIIVYISVVISNIILALFTKCLDDKKKCDVSVRRNTSVSTAFVNAGTDASASMIGICAYVLLFSCFIPLVCSLTENQSIHNFIYGFTEVTIGCEALSKLHNIPLIAGIIAWGGIAVHFQIMDCIEKTNTDLRLFFASRLVSASISVIICDTLLKQFPVQVSAISQNANIRLVTNENSLPVSIAMLITCFLFLIGDYTINSRIKRYKNVETNQII